CCGLNTEGLESWKVRKFEGCNLPTRIDGVTMSVKTYTPKGAEVEAQRDWYLINADGLTLGRLATLIAQVLRGKNKPTFTPHMDMGDYVIVINADQVVVTGKKGTDKMYYRHSGYIGNLKAIPFNEMMQKHPTFAVREAVR